MDWQEIAALGVVAAVWLWWLARLWLRRDAASRGQSACQGCQLAHSSATPGVQAAKRSQDGSRACPEM